jgi:hypothetical protein
MSKKKYVIRFFLTCALFGLLLSGATRKEVYAQTDDKMNDIMELTGIMTDITGNPVVQNKYVTREEFAQILVQASPYAGKVKNSNKYKLFKDVNQNSKKAAYIQIAVSKGYMSGYLSGNFKPAKAVIFREAIYGTLELLGFTQEDFIGKLSSARYDKFNELGLGKNISCKEEDKLTKKDCETLFYNLLKAKQKSGDVYAKALGYPVDEEGNVSYQEFLEKKLKGPYLTKLDWEKNLTRKLSSYNIVWNNQKMLAQNIKDYSIVYFSDQTNDLWVYDSKVYGSLDSITYNDNKPQEFIIAGTNYTIEKPDDMKRIMKASNIKKGMMVALLLGRDDKVSYVLPIQSGVAGGGWQQVTGFDINLGTIYKEGIKITPDKVVDTDIIYYSKEIRTVWVYSKKVYGVVDAINPSAEAPEGIVVAGNTYDLKAIPVNSFGKAFGDSEDITENAWGTRLRENGIAKGDSVVVLFGYNGNVVDISKVNKMPVTLSGYVLSIENKVIKDENKESDVKQIIRIVDTEGIIREFPSSDYKITKDSVVEVRFELGKPVITKIESYDSNNIQDITSKVLTDDIRVIEINKEKYKKVSAATLKEVTWDISNVIYCKLNDSGEITDLILRNVTDSFYQYGFLKKVVFPNAEKGIYNFQMTFDIANNETTIVIDNPKWNFNIGPKAIQIEDNTVKDMKDLEKVRISYISGKQANTGNVVYRIADDVLVYFYKNGEYYKGDFDDITNNSNSIIDGYAENLQQPIRLIVVTK